MSAFDIKKSCEFDGIAFPVMEVSLMGGIRRHTHIFPYSPGGPTELMARDNYKIKVKSVFCDSYKNYGESLYPTALNELRRRFEAQRVAPLNVPNLGVIRAYAFNWNFSMSSKVQNGEDVEITFEEDTTELFSVETILQQKASGFNALNDGLKIEIDAIKKVGLLESVENVLDMITNFSDRAQSVIDTAQLFDSMIAGKIDALTDILERATDDVELFKDPNNLTLIEAVKNLWFASIDLKDTIAGTGLLKPYVVQRDSTLSEVCIAIYGDTSRAQELLSLNYIDDPFLITAQTPLIYKD
jgi:prophage DNA circulation protein